MIEYLPDTNVLSRVFKGDLDVTKFVESLECAIDATVYYRMSARLEIQSGKAHH